MVNIRRNRNGTRGNGSVGYWIIGFLFIAVIVIWSTLYFIGLSKEVAPNGVAYSNQEVLAKQKVNAVAEYINFVNNINKRAYIDLPITVNGLIKLSDALSELGGPAVEDQARLIEENANAMLETDDYLLSSQIAGEAFLSAATALKTIQENKIPAAEKDALQVLKVAQSYDSDRLMLEQKVILKDFFNATANVLRKADAEIERPS